MKSDDPNPFVLQHKDNALHAWRCDPNASFADTTKVNVSK